MVKVLITSGRNYVRVCIMKNNKTLDFGNMHMQTVA